MILPDPTFLWQDRTSYPGTLGRKHHGLSPVPAISQLEQPEIPGMQAEPPQQRGRAKGQAAWKTLTHALARPGNITSDKSYLLIICDPEASQDFPLVTNICYKTHTPQFPPEEKLCKERSELASYQPSPPPNPTFGSWVPAWACLFLKFPAFCLGFSSVCSQNSSQVRESLPADASQEGNRN